MNHIKTQVLLSSKTTFLALITLSVIVSSCKHQKKIVFGNTKCILEPKTAKFLTRHLKENEFKFERLNAKINAEAIIDSSENSFSVTLRMRKDSIIWMSISKLGIEGARLMITKDSVKFMNRLKSQYFKGDFSYLSKLFNTDLDYEMLQSLLVGNSVEFYDEDEKIKSGVDNCLYTLGTIRKYKLRKVIEKGKELKESAQSIYMNPENFKIFRILFYEFNPDRSFDASFSNFKQIDTTSTPFPQNIECTIKAQKTMFIKLTYSKIALNEEQSFGFKIPDNYEAIKIKEK